MERERTKREPEDSHQGATDMEVAPWLCGHIDNPCGVEVVPGEVANIRRFYIDMARERIAGMTNDSAREVLLEKIKEYEHA